MVVSRQKKGFTLIELIVVMTIVALLLSLAVPRYFKSVDQAKEATLKQNLATMREAIDKFYGDNENYPASLNELVTRQYLKSIPTDPLTELNSSWVIVQPEDGSNKVFDVRSGAPGKDKNGIAYTEW